MIEISDTAVDAIRRHGQKTYPEECCGALLGEAGDDRARIARAQPMANDRSDERHRRFRISPEEYLKVERRAEQDGLALIGFYHSHPDHPAVPSAYDRDHALPFFHYIVLAVSAGEPGEMSSWTLSEDRGDFRRDALCPTDSER